MEGDLRTCSVTTTPPAGVLFQSDRNLAGIRRMQPGNLLAEHHSCWFSCGMQTGEGGIPSEAQITIITCIDVSTNLINRSTPKNSISQLKCQLGHNADGLYH